MNKHLKKVINYSNGKWKRVSKLRQEVDLSGLSGCPISGISKFGAIVVETLRNENEEVVWYRAYDTTGCDYFELARLRKSAGILSAPESFSLRRSA